MYFLVSSWNGKVPWKLGSIDDQFGNIKRHLRFLLSKYWYWYLRTSRQIDGLVVGRQGLWILITTTFPFLFCSFKNLPHFCLTFNTRSQCATGLKQQNLKNIDYHVFIFGAGCPFSSFKDIFTLIKYLFVSLNWTIWIKRPPSIFQ